MTLRTILSVLMLTGANGCVFSAPSYRGPRSDHFDGSKFHNQVIRDMGFTRFWKWITTRAPGPWSEHNHNKVYPAPPARVEGGKAVFTFINHATYLIQVDGLNILTDPIWSERASPFSFIGPKRARPPGVAFDDLPKIDVVLISHNHYDHLDVDTLKKLNARDHPLVITGLGNGLLLAKKGITNCAELDWWQERQVSEKLSVVGVPAQHFSGRGLFDRDKTLWTGHVIKSSAGNFFFAGDTGFGPHFQAIRERLSPIKVALIPIGAFIPEWFMGHVHLSPQGAVDAAVMLGAEKSFGIHFGTFRLADDGENEPIEKLHEALSKLPTPPDFTTLDFGESWEFKA
jgi:L-ascorbate metabolism protein UlaG (beta-lactamase superfamily)